MFIRKKIGNGITTSFWWDPWLNDGPVALREDLPRVMQSGLGEVVSVAEAWNWSGGVWPNLEIFNKVRGIGSPLNNNSYDKLVWRDVKDYPFSTNRAWKSIREKNGNVKWYNLVWKAPIIPRCSFTSWVVARDRLPTKGRMKNQGIVDDAMCIFCEREEENIDHLFFKCEYSNLVWKLIIKDDFGWMNFHTYKEWQEWASKTWKGKEHRRIRLLFNTTLDVLWKERNYRIHERKCREARILAFFISSSVDVLLDNL